MALYRFNDKLVLFVHIPKTGGTSTMRLLASIGGMEAFRQPVPNPDLPCTPQHFHAAILRDLIPPGFVDLAFTIVRNPFDRLASEYRMRIQEPQHDLSFDEWVLRTLRRYRRNPFINDNHVRPQHEFLMPGVRQFRFEAAPFQAICDAMAEFGVAPPADIPWERRAAHLPLTMTPETARSIVAFYAADFEALCYSWEDLGNTLRLA